MNYERIPYGDRTITVSKLAVEMQEWKESRSDDNGQSVILLFDDVVEALGLIKLSEVAEAIDRVAVRAGEAYHVDIFPEVDDPPQDGAAASVLRSMLPGWFDAVRREVAPE